MWLCVQVDMIAMKDTGILLLAFNDAVDSRSLLTLATSNDAGHSWVRVVILEDDPAGSFSYPTILDLPAQVWLCPILLSGSLHRRTCVPACPAGAACPVTQRGAGQVVNTASHLCRRLLRGMTGSLECSAAGPGLGHLLC